MCSFIFSVVFTGFRGSVTVVALASRHENIQIEVNGLIAATQQSALDAQQMLRNDNTQSPCSLEPATPSVPAAQTLQYTYSV